VIGKQRAAANSAGILQVLLLLGNRLGN
jgi:hypothetical protein